MSTSLRVSIIDPDVSLLTCITIVVTQKESYCLKCLRLSSSGRCSCRDAMSRERYSGVLVDQGGFTKEDLDAARYFVLRRISVRKETLQRQ